MVKTDRDQMEGIHALPAFPVVLVTAGENIMTAAAFSFYSFEPACVMVGIRAATLTFELISERGEFGINIPTKAQIDAVGVCGSVSGRSEDKFARTGFTRQPGSAIDSHLIAECPVNLECRVVHTVKFGGSHTWFIGQLEAVHIDEDYTRDQALMYWLEEYRAVGEILLETKRG